MGEKFGISLCGLASFGFTTFTSIILEPFKNLYNRQFYLCFTAQMQEVYPAFDEAHFLKCIFTPDWEAKELKQRMRHTTLALRECLSGRYDDDLDILCRLSHKLLRLSKGYDSLAYMFIPDYLEVNGLPDEKRSLKAMETITQLASCEFAIRPFIQQNPEGGMQQMQQWAEHENEHVRRLASEGCRPRLPWGMALKTFKQDPNPILPILEKLKHDASEYVRRSVANNLNDISKDHPALVLDIAKKWLGYSKATDGVVKHAARTLLKAGNQDMMALFGYGASDALKIENFSLDNAQVQVGDYLHFSFALKNTSDQTAKVRLEYALYFLKKNGEHSRKIFKISEKEYAANSKTLINRKQHFKPITTRVYYPGKHKVAVVVNGVEHDGLEFGLDSARPPKLDSARSKDH